MSFPTQQLHCAYEDLTVWHFDTNCVLPFWEAEALPKTQSRHLLSAMIEEPGISNFLDLGVLTF